MAAEITNPLTGEACITDDERDVSYHLVGTIEAVVAVERMTGLGVLDIVEKGRPSLTQTAMIITAFAEGYSRRHPGTQKALNPKLALKLIAAAGGYTDILPIVVESLIKAEGLDLYDFDAVEEEDAPAADADDDGEDPFAGD